MCTHIQIVCIYAYAYINMHTPQSPTVGTRPERPNHACVCVAVCVLLLASFGTGAAPVMRGALQNPGVDVCGRFMDSVGALSKSATLWPPK